MFKPFGKQRYCSDDCRHGTDAGYAAGCRCDPCTAAHAKVRNLNRLYPERTLVPILGSRRRVEALACIGWGARTLSRRLGRHDSFLRKALAHDLVHVDTARMIASLYDELSMTPSTDPTAVVVKRVAARRGYVPALAWNDIDDPNEAPTGWEYQPPSRDDLLAEYLDDVSPDTLTAVAAAGWHGAADVKHQIIGAWDASGRPLAELERITGWKPDRYYKRREQAA